MVKPIKIALATLPLTLFIACAPTEQQSFSGAKNLMSGSDKDMAFCRDFRLTKEEAAQLLNQSRVITTKEMHDHHEYLPCYVKGTVNYDGKTCDFTIRAGGTTELVCQNGKNYVLVCDDCNDLLGGF